MAEAPALKKRGSQRWWLVALVVVVIATAAASPWLVDRWSEWTTSLQTLAEEAPASQLASQRGLAGSESVLIVATDADEEAMALALVTNPEGGDGVVMLIPPGLFEVLPGFGEDVLAVATRFEGPELARLAISNALGIRIDEVLHLSPGDFAAALGGPVTVQVPAQFVVATEEGSQMVADAGSAVYPAETVERMLLEQGESEPLEWLERQAAVWSALLAAMATDGAVNERLVAGVGDQATVTGVLAGTAANNPQVMLVPLERAAGAGDVDGFTLDATEVPGFVTAEVPHLQLATEPRVRVEVLNGNGRIGTTRPVAESLINAGFHVVITDNANRFDFPETLVIAQGSEQRASADLAAETMKVGVVQVEPRAVSRVVDVSIIVGHDMATGEG